MTGRFRRVVPNERFSIELSGVVKFAGAHSNGSEA
jgi:hypothetical protein